MGAPALGPHPPDGLQLPVGGDETVAALVVRVILQVGEQDVHIGRAIVIVGSDVVDADVLVLTEEVGLPLPRAGTGVDSLQGTDGACHL
jgi:hypothetical protein